MHPVLFNVIGIDVVVGMLGVGRDQKEHPGNPMEDLSLDYQLAFSLFDIIQLGKGAACMIFFPAFTAFGIASIVIVDVEVGEKIYI